MAIETDVLIVGAGPAGLATAIALKRRRYPGRVVVLDKGRTIGGHVLSGAVVDPSGFKELLTQDEFAHMPFDAHVSKESYRLVLGADFSVPVPWIPPMMRAKGFPVGSLSKMVRYMADIAVKLGAEVYPGYAVESLVERDGVVVGAKTGAKGLDAEGMRKSNYLAPEVVLAKTTVLAEGAAGVLTDRLVSSRGMSGARPQSHAVGIKERFELPAPACGSAGTIMHAFGYPVDMTTYGGGFVYHTSDQEVVVGYVVGLDYHDPSIDVHELFRRFKATKAVQRHIAGGKAVSYGAKVIPEGGFYAVPRPHAPGVLVVGDAAGLLDGLRIKGVHIAVQSGMAAAAAILEGIGDAGPRYAEMLAGTRGWREMRRVRNVHAAFACCAPLGVVAAGLAWATFGAFPFWMVGRGRLDCKTTRPTARGRAAKALPASGVDKLTDVFMSGVLHEENQPCHLRVLDPAQCDECEGRFGSPCTRFCPAAVYSRAVTGLRIDFSNCLHCKTCRIKCPFQNIEWNFPQGGDGPRYSNM